jgi:hypothetical protein
MIVKRLDPPRATINVTVKSDAVFKKYIADEASIPDAKKMIANESGLLKAIAADPALMNRLVALSRLEPELDPLRDYIDVTIRGEELEGTYHFLAKVRDFPQLLWPFFVKTVSDARGCGDAELVVDNYYRVIDWAALDKIDWNDLSGPQIEAVNDVLDTDILAEDDEDEHEGDGISLHDRVHTAISEWAQHWVADPHMVRVRSSAYDVPMFKATAKLSILIKGSL